MLENIAEYYKK